MIEQIFLLGCRERRAAKNFPHARMEGIAGPSNASVHGHPGQNHMADIEIEGELTVVGKSGYHMSALLLNIVDEVNQLVLLTSMLEEETVLSNFINPVCPHS